MKNYILKISIKLIVIIISINKCLYSMPIISFIEDKISDRSKGIILNFHNRATQILNKITDVDPDCSFEFYCDKVPYLTWGHHREFWNSANCSNEWFEHNLPYAYFHELAQLYFVNKILQYRLEEIMNNIFLLHMC